MVAGFDFVLRDSLQKARERDAPFEPRKCQADANMRAACKGEMPVGFAADVKDIGVAELIRVAVGRPDT